MIQILDDRTTGRNALISALVVTGTAYASISLILASTAENPIGNVGRVLIVTLLCVQVARGANWARLLLGAFVLPLTAFLLLSAPGGTISAVHVTLLALALVASIAYLSLFLRREAAGEFARRRAARTPPPRSAP
jgi:hypothetical protein